MILVIYLLKTIDLSNRRKKLKKSQPEERIAEKVKLRRQKIMIRNYLTHHQILLMKIMMVLLIFQICHH